MTSMQKYGEAIEVLQGRITYHLTHSCFVPPEEATESQKLRALSLSVRERLTTTMLETRKRQRETGAKTIAYLSMEFLVGRSLENNLLNLDMLTAARAALTTHGTDLERLANHEPDAALGNGGLGRLAACFLESMASLDLAGYGYGISYEFGLFRQRFQNGEQREEADAWASSHSPWMMERLEESVAIPVYGKVDHGVDKDGNYNPMWMEWKLIIGVPHDLPIVGAGGRTVNTLRLFSARAANDFDIATFNAGEYVRAIEEKIEIEKISKVLYPSDAVASGRELRLVQEYFLVACAMRDLFRRLKRDGAPLQRLPDYLAVQLNDTHPALAVAELMRVLVDEHSIEWARAWELTRRTLAYTNHTLLPEALETWPVELLERVVPRHLQIIYQINWHFLEEVAETFPGDSDRLRRMSLVDEASPRTVRMAHLAIVGSHSVNGVAALHSELVKTQLVPDFYAMWPERFNNKTNGVTPRRWMRLANPELSKLLDESIGSSWTTSLHRLRELAPLAQDSAFLDACQRAKLANKKRLIELIADTTRELISPASLFDVQAKRVHEYKRQLLNALHIIHMYVSIVDDHADVQHPRTFIFAGKAAPGYYMAKRIIALIHDIARVVNRDPRSRDALRVVYIPDYRVSLAERIIPAADLSEQISTAGKEASGTGNMKFAMNGALTIGTMDGANIEICEEVGDDNIFMFGLKSHEAETMHSRGYLPRNVYRQDPRVTRVIDAIRFGRFSSGDGETHRAIVDSLLERDEYLLLADFSSYLSAQARVTQAFGDRKRWYQMAVKNIAGMGKFSSDRTISEYAAEIWKAKPV